MVSQASVVDSDIQYDDCYGCGTTINIDDLTAGYCPECIDNMISCAWCGLSEYDDNIYYVNGDDICEDCYSRDVVFCEECDYGMHIDDSMYCECERTICGNCNHTCILRGVYEHHYKPRPIFHGDGPLYMGVELEVDAPNRIVDDIQPVLDNSNDETLFYLKEDGSLHNGFEIVTHPMSLRFHTKNFDWKRVVGVVEELGYSSHNTDTCGLHIHVSRNGLAKTSYGQELVISKLMILVGKHWDKMVQFSRRDSHSMRWTKGNHTVVNGDDDDNKKLLRAMETTKNRFDRYMAINIIPTETIEFRLFRGTLNSGTIIASLQFVDLLIHMCQTMGLPYIYHSKWEDIVRGAAKYPELVKYLMNRELM